MLVVSTIRRDNGSLSRIQRAMRSITGRIEIGYFNKMHTSKDGERVSMSIIAHTHEFGRGPRSFPVPMGRIPKRPYISPVLESNKGKYLRLAGSQITPVLLGRQSFKGGIDKIGRTAIRDIQLYMVNGTFAPLSPLTIKKKGTTKPLIDTGQLLQSIDYKVK